MVPREKDTAKELYTHRAREIGVLLRIVRERLADHAKGARRSPENWGIVGDLGRVRDGLVDLLAFLNPSASEAAVRSQIDLLVREAARRRVRS